VTAGVGATLQTTPTVPSKPALVIGSQAASGPATPPTPAMTAPKARPAQQSTPSGLLALLTGFLNKVFAPIPSAALAFGLMLGLMVPTLRTMWTPDEALTELPESYVGVLATPQAATGLIISSRRHGRVMDIKQVTPQAVPDGQTRYLWVIEADGSTMRPIGPLPPGSFVRVNLPDEAEKLFAKAKELAISTEPIGTQPAQPSSAFIYRGLCGKLWRVASPAAAAASR
jgi:Anti-sigma-K factor rskA